MAIQRWDPFNEFRHMQNTMNRLWRGYDNRGAGESGIEEWAVPLDVIKDGDDIVVRASVPGVNPNDVHITVENDVLTIRGESKSGSEVAEGNYLMRERRSGSFHRSLRLPDTVDVDGAETSYDNGVVSINFPKMESKKARRLELKVG